MKLIGVVISFPPFYHIKYTQYLHTCMLTPIK
nr:MAG TPA: hypothetical protein [Caudoviricetes sp.]